MERVSRDTAGTASVRRLPTKTLLGQKGGSLIRLLPRSEALRQRLDRAGIRLNAVDFALLCGAAGACAALLLHLLCTPPWPISAGLGVIVATGAPHFLVERRSKKRKQQFLSQFADAIDLIVRGVRSGLPVAEALHAAGLRVLSSEFREHRMLRAEEKAARLPATLTVPMIVFILPTLFIVLVGPAMIDVYDNLSK